MGLMEQLGALFDRLGTSIANLLPHVLGAVAILLVGLVVAYIVREIAERVLKNFGRWIPSKWVRAKFPPSQMERPAEIISKILFWIVVFFFLTAATEALGLPVVTTWLSGIAIYLPRVLAAALIVIAGILGGILLRDLVTAGSNSAGLQYSQLLGKLTQYTIIVLSVFIAIEQLGVDITFLSGLLMILFAAMLFGAALAFGLGARDSVSNILASYFVQKRYHVGQTLKVDQLEGQITEITSTALILKTKDGQVYIPAKQLNNVTSILVKE